jgi:hypothetical protein
MTFITFMSVLACIYNPRCCVQDARDWRFEEKLAVGRSWRCILSRPGMLALLVPAGCSPAPSQDILGSFFPSWMLCTAIGVAVAVSFRIVFGVVGLDKHLLAPPLAYLGVTVAVTLFTWLYRFGQ